MEKNYKVELEVYKLNQLIDVWFFESAAEAKAFVNILKGGNSTDTRIKLYFKEDWTLDQNFYNDVPF